MKILLGTLIVAIDMGEWKHHTARFKVNEKSVKLDIVHNLPEVSGMNFEGALENWLVRTESYTEISLCKYIMSKELYGVKAYPKTKWDKLQTQIKKNERDKS